MYKFNVLQDDIYMAANAVSDENMIGRWTRPIENMPRKVEIFELRPNSIAVSINMATLPYTPWQLMEGRLILKGKSIGNGSSSNVTEIYTINSIGEPNMFVMNEQGREIVFDHKPLKEPLDQ